MSESAQAAERDLRAGTCETEAAACPGVLALIGVTGVGARVRSSAAAPLQQQQQQRGA